MTNAEAIRIINQYDCNFYWTDGEKIPTEDLIEAFYMAGKALKEVDYLRSICRKDGRLTCMFHKNDDPALCSEPDRCVIGEDGCCEGYKYAGVPENWSVQQ